MYKKYIYILLIIIYSFISIFNYQIRVNDTENKIEKSTLVNFIPQDRPFGENMVNIPTKNCIAMYKNLEKEIENLSKREGVTKITEFQNENSYNDLCTMRNLSPFITYGDLDGDFLSEVMFSNKNGDIYIYWNTGNGFKKDEFLSNNITYLTKNDKLDEKSIFLFIDVNNDKINDIVISPNDNRNSLITIINKKNRNFDTINLNYFMGEEEAKGTPTNVTTDDLNKDGLADIIFTTQDHKNYPIRIFISNNDTKISYTEETSKYFEKENSIKDIDKQKNNTLLIADFNSDDKLDIFLASNNYTRIFYQRNKKFIPETITGTEDYDIIGAKLLDLNTDNKIDILATSNKGIIEIINRNNNLTISKNNSSKIENISNAMGFSSRDYNMDGYLDLFIGTGFPLGETKTDEHNLMRPYLFLTKNNGYVDETGSIFRKLVMIESTSIISSTDFNGDYQPDILLSSEEMRKPHLLINNTETKNNSTAIMLRGKGLGGSPVNGEGAIITIKIKDKPIQKFKIPSTSSNYNSYSANSPIIIGLGEESKAKITVEFPSGKKVEENIYANKVNMIYEE